MSKSNIVNTITKDINKHKFKYLVILPVIIYFILFHYKPMYGLIIAFKRFKPHLGIWESQWVGLQHFKSFFSDFYFWRILRNTFSISILSIIFSFPAPVLLALLLNEVKVKWFKKSVQTITYMPHFIAMVVVCSLVRTFTQTDGLVTDFVVMLGGERQNLLNFPAFFYPIYIISGIWQNVGWDSIIYLAALSGIDQEQYEAARVDGAGRIRQMIHITLPGIFPTISILLILRMGSLLSVGYEKILLLYQPLTYEVADVISTYVYRRGIVDANYSYSTAVGLFNSVINVFFLLLSNKISKKLGQSGLF